jgi:hypothetical protein
MECGDARQVGENIALRFANGEIVKSELVLACDGLMGTQALSREKASPHGAKGVLEDGSGRPTSRGLLSKRRFFYYRRHAIS